MVCRGRENQGAGWLRYKLMGDHPCPAADSGLHVASLTRRAAPERAVVLGAHLWQPAGLLGESWVPYPAPFSAVGAMGARSRCSAGLLSQLYLS